MSTNVQAIINEINTLQLQELEIVRQEVNQKIKRLMRVEAILSEVMGIGKGIWTQDAQEYVNDLREDRIF